jgi:hypothetical protein
MADTRQVDIALIGYLSADAELMALLPGGVWWDQSPLGLTKVCIVGQLTHLDAYVLSGDPLWERITYLVKAVTQGSSSVTANDAAARMDALLLNARFAITGYQIVNCERQERVRYAETDDETDLQWQHSGGHYELIVAPIAVGLAA